MDDGDEEGLRTTLAAVADIVIHPLGGGRGLGTLEEIIEVWSWRQIGFNNDPVGFLNVNEFWTPLLTTLDKLVDTGFVRRSVLDDLVVAATLDEALEALS